VLIVVSSLLTIYVYMYIYSLDQFMKRVAKLRQREIIIRDANRIHHFKTNGECSCKDHF
jgi:hypothetical protein